MAFLRQWSCWYAPFCLVLVSLQYSVSQSSAQLNRANGTWTVPSTTNVWFSEAYSADTVVVFVHGIGSDNNAWLYVNADGRSKQYWPYLVCIDGRMDHPSVFLGGYSYGSNIDLFDASDQLRNGLEEHGVFKYKNIVFIAHSLGGIVVRRLLVHSQNLFKGKNVGLVLFASPSGGSYWAEYAKKLPQLSQYYLIRRLVPGDAVLRELDHDFRDLVQGEHQSSEDRINIRGKEAVESSFIFGKGIPSINAMQVVPTPSGNPYFNYETIPDTDHSSIVKPASLDSPSHRFFRSFYKAFEESNHIAEAKTSIPVIPAVTPPAVTIPYSPLPAIAADLQSEIWLLVKSWAESIQSGNVEANHAFYTETLSRYYLAHNYSSDRIARELSRTLSRYQQRSIEVSNSSFQQLSKDEVEITFDKTFKFVRPDNHVFQGEVRSDFHFIRVDGDIWKISEQYDTNN